MSMPNSLRALLTGIVDYAGLFPPAQLPLGEAVRNYVQYRNQPDQWMLSRFVCPAALLKELARFPEWRTVTHQPSRISVLGKSGQSVSEFLKSLHEIGESVREFQVQMADVARIDTFEVRVGADWLYPHAADELGGAILQPFSESNREFAPKVGFYEVEFGSSWRASIAQLVGLMANNEERSSGLKVRCACTNASGIPSAEDLAVAIVTCRDAGVPLKFTAGLHHPFRQAPAHGFLNVFCAGVLAQARRMDLSTIERIVAADDPKHFQFADEEIRWMQYSATLEQIAAARRQLVISFGSCSFDEPRDDLRVLGMW